MSAMFFIILIFSKVPFYWKDKSGFWGWIKVCLWF